MKQNKWLYSAIVFASLTVFSIVLTSCRKDNDLPTEQTPVAALAAYNLAPDQSSVNVRLSGNVLPPGSIPYPAYTGSYLNVYAGNRVVKVFGANSTQPLDTTTYNFEPNKYYSLFVVGSGTTHRNIITRDNYDSLSAGSGKAYVRYINALSNTSSSNVSIQMGGSNIVNTAASFGQVSGFTAVDPGNIIVTVSNEGVQGVNRTIALESRRAYTLLLTGLPNQTDSAKTVQIRYVVNGTVGN